VKRFGVKSVKSRSIKEERLRPIRIRTGNREYHAIIGSNLLGKVGSAISSAVGRSTPRCAIISDTNVAPLFGDQVKRSLTETGFQPVLIALPPGERSKTLAQAGAICDQMIASGLDRQSLVIGLGGGVVGDISGFVAAIFLRGIPHVQIATTLLAMMDSSIGGKTGVNTSAGKNLLGAIHHPLLVIDDVDVLETLPRRQFNQGFAEIIKQAIIADAAMFQKVAQLSKLRISGTANPPRRIRPVANWKLAPLIRQNIEIKSKIVAKDEFDRMGERALLNFGHTIGHAIERAGAYRVFLHGEAVSLGIVAACGISMKKAGLRKEERDAVVDLLGSFKLPTRLPKTFARNKILDALRFDKKFESGKIRFVLTSRIGSAHLSSAVTMEDIAKAVAQL
jgi:3-dehydroquinate synthase